MGRHERAVANTLGFAQEAAARGDFTDALQWLGVVEIVDGVSLRPRSRLWSFENWPARLVAVR
jgi:hypothetical protein